MLSILPIFRSAPASPTHGLQYQALNKQATASTSEIQPQNTALVQVAPTTVNSPAPELLHGTVSFQQIPAGGGMQPTISTITTSSSGTIQAVTLQPAEMTSLIKQEVPRVPQGAAGNSSSEMVVFQQQGETTKTPLSAGAAVQNLLPVSVAVLPTGTGMYMNCCFVQYS